MYIIAGLGNPEKKYDKTRHNMGFRIIDELADRHNIGWNVDTKHKGVIGKGTINGEKVVLVKPLTYMNLSGECLRAMLDFYKSDTDEVIVLYDDISMEPGKIRVRKKGSAGGHNGIKSIIAHLGTDIFPRLKFGVGDKPARMDLADHVLGCFAKEDEEKVVENIPRACDAVECMLSEGIDSAMNKYNG